MRSPQGNFAIKPRYRKFAVRPDKPDVAAWTDGAAVSSDGTFSEDFSLSGLGENLWIQPAIGGAVTSGAAGEGFVSWQAFTDHRLSDDPEDPFVLEEELTGDEAIFLAAAKALLLENLDLVEWVVCFACYAADVPDPQHIINCILDGLTGGARRYLYAIDSFTGRGKGGPTGAATDIFAPADGGTGVVVPIRHPVWRDAVAAYTAAIDAGDDVSAMAAASAMSNNILHELMHLCTSELGEPALADDVLSCWAIQNMVGISFIWALAQRYPCLQGLDYLPKADDYYFMTSEPEGGEEIFPWDASKPVCGRRG